MTPRALALTAPGGPLGWPAGDLSLADALAVLGRASGTPYVLGIDQAATSGYAVVDPTSGRVVASGTTSSTETQVAALESLRALPGFELAAVLVVFDDHGGIDPLYRQRFDPKTGKAPDRSPRVAVGLGDARGGWRVLLDLRAQPKAQRRLAAPSEWRRVLKGARLPGDDLKTAAVRWASARVGRRLTSADEAEAVGIATWGAVDGLRAFAADRLRARAAARARKPEGPDARSSPASLESWQPGAAAGLAREPDNDNGEDAGKETA